MMREVARSNQNWRGPFITGTPNAAASGAFLKPSKVPWSTKEASPSSCTCMTRVCMTTW